MINQQEMSRQNIAALNESPEITDLKPLPPTTDALIPAGQTYAYLGVSTQTLARWRMEGFGPPFVKLGRGVFYRAGDLRAWIESCVRQNTIQQDMDKK